jgi:4a-hydroxytetrahydrobiopterin dehydratase
VASFLGRRCRAGFTSYREDVMVTPLEGSELDAAVEGLTDWRLVDGHLVRDVTCASGTAQGLVDAVGVEADAMDHHPVVDVTGDEVRFTVWSHSLDAITTNDVVLAGKIDEVVAKTV